MRIPATAPRVIASSRVPELSAPMALQALRAMGLDYRPDLRVAEGQWIAQCPTCFDYFDDLRLTVRETPNDVGLVCKSGCTWHQIVVRMLAALQPQSPENRLRALELRVDRLEATG